jgi:hypothetical protein
MAALIWIWILTFFVHHLSLQVVGGGVVTTSMLIGCVVPTVVSLTAADDFCYYC